MENNTPTTKRKQLSNKSIPFIASAKMVVGVGAVVLGLVGRAIKGATALLIKNTKKAPVKDQLPANTMGSSTPGHVL